ncbi:MAG: hypothetical protein ACRD0W_16885 [Acidimicrobiales bacterium]
MVDVLCVVVDVLFMDRVDGVSDALLVVGHDVASGSSHGESIPPRGMSEHVAQSAMTFVALRRTLADGV